MARFTNGWVKVYRSIGEGDLVDNPILLALWIRLLTLATWRPSKILYSGKQRVLPPGTVVFGVKEISETWAVSRSVIQKWLHYLHDTGRIVLAASPRGTIVSICNWETYQSQEIDDATESVNSGAAPSSLSVSSEALIEEGKKRRRKEGARTGVRAEYTAAFEEAWEAYGKVGKKLDASKAFEALALTQEERQSLLVGIKAYLADLKAKDRLDFQMHFATFLRDDWRVWTERRTPTLAFRTVEDVINGR